MKNTKCYIYTRVSTSMQDLGRLRLNAQLIHNLGPSLSQNTNKFVHRKISDKNLNS